MSDLKQLIEKYNTEIDSSITSEQLKNIGLMRTDIFRDVFKQTYKHLPRKKKKAAKKRQEKEREESMLYIAGKMMEDFAEKAAILYAMKYNTQAILDKILNS